VLAVRSDAALGPERACVDRNVAHLLGHPFASAFVFCTPRDLVSILDMNGYHERPAVPEIGEATRAYRA
jgi:hypothetical protein